MEWIRRLHGGQVVLLEILIAAAGFVLVVVNTAIFHGDDGWYMFVAVVLICFMALIAVPWAWLAGRANPARQRSRQPPHQP
jgi:hypothetical protein